MIEVALFALLGSVFQEMLYWYQLRSKLNQKKYKLLLKSSSYWFVTMAMVLLTPAVVVALVNADNTTTFRTSVLMGAGLPLLFKNLVAAFVQMQSRVMLGHYTSSQDEKPDLLGNLVNYFGWRNQT